MSQDFKLSERFLHLIWKYKISSIPHLKTIEGDDLQILSTGVLNTHSGPDFSFAKMHYRSLLWNGDVEIHLKSSDFLTHQHSHQPEYQSLILHVVYEHDKNIPFLMEKQIPTLELKSYIQQHWIANYKELENREFQFIPCEKLINSEIPKHLPGWEESLVIEKLEKKSVEIFEDLKKLKGNWEAVTFARLAYAFGLSINSLAFAQLAQPDTFGVIQKIQSNRLALEALFFGVLGELQEEKDDYQKSLKSEFEFLQKKFNIPFASIPLKYLRLRPPNFPTIRLSQLADTIHKHPRYFHFLTNTFDYHELVKFFDSVRTAEYWQTHYTFGHASKKKVIKKLSKPFVDRIILNAVIPVAFAYHKHIGSGIEEELLALYTKIPVEKNSIVHQWERLMDTKYSNSLQTQALLFLHKHFCKTVRCLECRFGWKILFNYDGKN